MKTTDTSLPIFFIIGRGRSGSTLLQMMLDAHPNIKIPGEGDSLCIYTKNMQIRNIGPMQL